MVACFVLVLFVRFLVTKIPFILLLLLVQVVLVLDRLNTHKSFSVVVFVISKSPSFSRTSLFLCLSRACAVLFSPTTTTS